MALVSMLHPGAYVKAGDSNTHVAAWTEGDTRGLRIEILCCARFSRLLPGEVPATTH